MKLPAQVDRESFWMWAVPLVLAHVAASTAAAHGIQVLGAADLPIILFLAAILAARFRDIGWPTWIPPTFVLTTLVLLPLVAVGFAIANRAASTHLLDWLTSLGIVTGAANLILIAVAGSVPGTAQDNSPAMASPAGAATLPADALTVSSAPQHGEFGKSAALVIGISAVAFVLVLAAAFSGVFTPSQQSSQLPRPPLKAGDMKVESNGLTKSTNDFLRQLSQSPANRR